MHEPEPVTWVECPRDAWQSLTNIVPTPAKTAHLSNLLAANFSHLDAGSFVSPKAVPQMADTEQALAPLKVPPAADVLCIIGNERGLSRAVAASGVTSVGYPLSVNDTFQRRNLGLGTEESWPVVQSLRERAEEAGLGFVVYVSMGFGNPYGEPWSPAVTAEAVARLRSLGVTRIALADTVGNADAENVDAVLSAVGEPERLGLHLHARPGEWRPQVERALALGVRWFEGALGGVGGCPFAQDELVGNLPTENVVPFLESAGFTTGVNLASLRALTNEAQQLASAASI